MYCPQCGNKLVENDRFCRRCGIQLNRDSIETEPLATDVLELPQQPVNGFRTLLFWGSLVTAVGFWLPWFSVLGLINYNGWHISNGLMQANIQFLNGPFYSLLLYLV